MGGGIRVVPRSEMNAFLSSLQFHVAADPTILETLSLMAPSVLIKSKHQTGKESSAGHCEEHT